MNQATPETLKQQLILWIKRWLQSSQLTKDQTSEPSFPHTASSLAPLRHSSTPSPPLFAPSPGSSAAGHAAVNNHIRLVGPWLLCSKHKWAEEEDVTRWRQISLHAGTRPEDTSRGRTPTSSLSPHSSEVMWEETWSPEARPNPIGRASDVWRRCDDLSYCEEKRRIKRRLIN